MSKAEQQRVSELHGVCDAVLAEHRAWQDSDATDPPDSFWGAISTMLAAFGEFDPQLGFVFADVPRSCRPLAFAAMQVESESHAFLGRAAPYFTLRPGQVRYPLTASQPRSELWGRIQRLRDLRDTLEVVPAALPPLESMHALAAQKLYPRQIATVWDCSTAQVEQELAEPGSVCTPEFCAAAERRRRLPRWPIPAETLATARAILAK